MRFPGLHQQSSRLIALSSKCKQIVMLLQQHMLSVQQAPALYSSDCFIPIAQLQNLQYCWPINNTTLVPVSTIISWCCRRLRLQTCKNPSCSRSIKNSCTTAAQVTSVGHSFSLRSSATSCFKNKKTAVAELRKENECLIEVSCAAAI